jgi:hypothetical protein
MTSSGLSRFELASLGEISHEPIPDRRVVFLVHARVKAKLKTEPPGSSHQKPINLHCPTDGPTNQKYQNTIAPPP